MRNAPTVRAFDRTTPPHLVTLVILAGIAGLTLNVFLPSLPRMTAHFQTDYAVMQLSVALYLGVNAVVQVLIGPISDRYGRRPVMLWSFVLFSCATVGCLLAPTAEIFLIFRMGQAVVAGGMVLGRAALRDMYSQEEAASMIAYVTMGMAIVPMVGPAIGGFLDQSFGWEANFVLMLLTGLFGTWLIWRDLGETNTQKSSSFSRQFKDYPELFSSPRFWGYAVSSAFASGAFFAYLGGAPLVATEVFDMDSSTLGMWFGAPALGYVFGNYITGRFTRRFGINRMILAGGIVCTSGLTVLSILFLVGLGSPAVFFSFVTCIGLGNGLVIPNATAGLLSVRPHLAGTASGLGGAVMLSGGALLSALAGALLANGSGPWPLFAMMQFSGFMTIPAILIVMRRERRLGLT